MTRTILQIVPKMPGTSDGVGDYASILAERLREIFSYDTIFTTPDTSFSDGGFEHIILHYVNYGYQKRGVPFALPSMLRKLCRKCPGRLVAIFHELYASGPPWKSAFWLEPLQKRIARTIAGASDVCIVSSELLLRQLRALAPDAEIKIHPVFSNFGEPSLSADQIANRSTHRWVICGGTLLVERSVRSFLGIFDRIPKEIRPEEVFVIAGQENPAVRMLVAAVCDRRKSRSGRWRRSQSAATTNLRVEYHPEITAADASQILSSCSFAWLDYFHRANVPGDALLKSGVFAAACAHGVITILPHAASRITLADDALPGPYFILADRFHLPEERQQIANEIYAWYHRQATSSHLAHGIASALGLHSSNSGVNN